MSSRVTLTPAHGAVLALLAWLPADAEADAARLLADLEAAGSYPRRISSLA